MVSDPTSFGNLLETYPELQKELNITVQKALAKINRHNFQLLKERVIVAEAFFNEKPDLPEDDQRAVVALIKDGGDLKELKANLKGWGSSTGGPPSILSTIKSYLVPKEKISRTIDGAARQTRRICDWEFLATLPDKVSKKPFLQQFAKDAVTEAHVYFQDFLKKHLPRLCSLAQSLNQRMVYRQIELRADNQDQKRRETSKSDWFNDVKLAQPQIDAGYVTISYK